MRSLKRCFGGIRGLIEGALALPFVIVVFMSYHETKNLLGLSGLIAASIGLVIVLASVMVLSRIVLPLQSVTRKAE